MPHAQTRGLLPRSSTSEERPNVPRFAERGLSTQPNRSPNPAAGPARPVSIRRTNGGSSRRSMKPR
jgi:hypothetical protein